MRFVVFTILVGIIPSCARRPDPERVDELRLPDRRQFIDGGVSAFMGRRCGSLDLGGMVGSRLVGLTVDRLGFAAGFNASCAALGLARFAWMERRAARRSVLPREVAGV